MVACLPAASSRTRHPHDHRPPSDNRPVCNQRATDLFRDLFNQDFKNISTANPDNFCQIIIAMKLFILSDHEFFSLFACKDVIAKAKGAAKCELEKRCGRR
jgi:hypothetical protein